MTAANERKPTREAIEAAILTRLEAKSDHTYQWPRWAAAYEASCAVADLLNLLICRECGNDEICEGHPYCSDCLEVQYECPRCGQVAPWTDGLVRTEDERDEFWCQTCGTETPLADMRVVGGAA